ALGLALRARERVDQRAIVLGVAGRLHDHVLVEAEKVAQREQLFLGRVTGRVFALGRVGKFAFRPEHVAVRIDGARWRDVLRLRRIGMKRDIAWAHRHGPFPSRASNPARARANRLGPPPRTWSRARVCPRASLIRAPRSRRAAPPTCPAGALARSPRRAD